MKGYERQWKDYRRLRNQFVLAWMGFFPVAVVLIGISRNQHSPRLGYATVIVWIALIFLTGIRVYFWRCPRCGKQYAPFAGSALINVQQCAHCGLPRNSD